MFKQENNVYKIVGRIFAAILSILLVVMLVGASVVTSARSLFSVKKITEIAKTVISEDTPALDDALSEIGDRFSDDGQMKEAVNAVLDSDAIKEVLGLYLDDATSALAGETAESRFTAENVGDILKNHTDDLAALLASKVPDLSADEVKGNLDAYVEERLPELMEELPTPEKIVTEVSGALEETGVGSVMKGFFSGAILWALWGVVAVLAVLILVCRLFRFRGLKWLGIDALVAALLLYPTALVFSSSLLPRNPTLVAVYTQLSRGILWSAVIVTIVGVLLIGANIALHFVFRDLFDAKDAQPETSVPADL